MNYHIGHAAEHERDIESHVFIFLDMQLKEFGEVWRALFFADKAAPTVRGPQWFHGYGEEEVEDINEVPRWCRAMADRMKPRIIEEHFQALIDAWKARQEEEAA